MPAPRRWSEISLDYKLFFAFHLSMMALFAAGLAISWEVKLGIASAIVTAIAYFSIRERRSAGWRWMGADVGRILFAFFTTALIVLFLFVAATMASPLNTAVLPWFLGGLGIGLMNVLTVLRIVRISGAEFEMDCRATAGFELAPSPPDTEPAWKKVARAAHFVVFVLVWLDGVAWFYFSTKSIREGSRSPSIIYSMPANEHGQIFYITSDQKRLNDLLGTTFSIGVPLVVASAFALHYLAGVRLFPTRESG